DLCSVQAEECLAVRIQQHREGVVLRCDDGTDLRHRLGVVDRDGDILDPLRLQLFVQRLHGLHLLLAALAPCSPEAHYSHLASSQARNRGLLSTRRGKELGKSGNILRGSAGGHREKCDKNWKKS